MLPLARCKKKIVPFRDGAVKLITKSAFEKGFAFSLFLVSVIQYQFFLSWHISCFLSHSISFGKEKFGLFFSSGRKINFVSKWRPRDSTDHAMYIYFRFHRNHRNLAVKNSFCLNIHERQSSPVSLDTSTVIMFVIPSIHFSLLGFSLLSRRYKGDSAVQLPRGSGWLGETEFTEQWHSALLLMFISRCHSNWSKCQGPKVLDESFSFRPLQYMLEPTSIF